MASGCAATGVRIEQYGTMRAALREGQTHARFALAEIGDRPNAVGVGGLEGLGGEITVLDGDVWVARPEGSQLRVSGPRPVDGDDATLLVLASVKSWRTVALETDGACEGRTLEALIEETARRHAIDTARPFPFVIEGPIDRLAIHVMNGSCPMNMDPDKGGGEPWRWISDKPVKATIVGFYAADSEGVMTHHGSAIHAHAIVDVDGKTVTGHVERLSVGPGATLRIPARS